MSPSSVLFFFTLQSFLIRVLLCVWDRPIASSVGNVDDDDAAADIFYTSKQLTECAAATGAGVSLNRTPSPECVSGNPTAIGKKGEKWDTKTIGIERKKKKRENHHGRHLPVWIFDDMYVARNQRVQSKSPYLSVVFSEILPTNNPK